jgi:hypothetical protein
LCFENYTGETSKLEACLELCEGMAANGHQILLFSQFTSMLDILRTRLEGMGLSTFTLQGSTPKEQRARLVKEFNAGGAQVFLISLKAGGTGLNLTAADVVIHYDPWWNLAAQNQATDRAHRMGQRQCVQVYKHFEDYTPKCMHFHGHMMLKGALAKSCNYFFFELGRRVGATTLTDYFKQFGLGVKTGVEVDDSKGILVEPESDKVGGTTLQIAIGQMNAFTPLQAANYVATLANGGTHYRASLVNQIVSYDIGEVYKTIEPEVVNKIKIKNSTLDAVKEGMLSVTEDGTGQAALGDYKIKVGGKTGTAQVNGAADHSIFIAFAPFDNPEIAISVVLENGASGFAAGSIVRDMLDAYFFADHANTSEDKYFVVLD